jgi:A/G-specific adenine glycosylase
MNVAAARRFAKGPFLQGPFLHGPFRQRPFQQGPLQQDPAASAALDRRTEPCQRLSQIVVVDLRHARGNARRGFGIGGSDGPTVRAPQWRLPQCDALNRAPAEEAIDAFANQAGEVLDFDRGRALDTQNKRSWRPGAGFVGAGPLDFDGFAVRGNFGAGDFGPACHQFGRRKALAGKGVAHDLAEEIAQRFGGRAGGLVHDKVLCHPSGKTEADMTVAAKAPGRQRAKTAAPDSVPQPAALLAWFDRHGRTLPWRAKSGERPDPYRVWLSEIMLQQTTVRSVAPYYARFLARWGDVRALAAAPLDDILKAWAGLGYYARARNLHACARAVVEWHGGKFPAGEAALRALPGIGDYTAAAIAAIAFDAPASPVDGNIERVVARLFAVADPLPSAKAELRRLARELFPQRRAGDFAQALMDLGATICTPKKPACAFCAWNESCHARARGDAETYPRRTPKREGALRRGAAFVARRADGYVLVRTRPPRGLLGGMTEVPTTEWSKDFDEGSSLSDAPLLFSPLPDGEREIFWRRRAGTVRHVFTHFPLELAVYLAEVPENAPAPAGVRWIAIAELGGEALPTLMRKVLAHALGERSEASPPPSRRVPSRAARR